MNIDIREGGLDLPAVNDLLRAHHADMLLHSPQESVHAIDMSAFTAANITFWNLWVIDNTGENLAGCGALKRLNAEHGEIKSMRTSKEFLRKGIAGEILNHIVEQARQQGYQRLSLETGSPDVFKPAQQLYLKHGFEFCPPFGDYQLDPYSVFMTKLLA